MSSRAAPVRPGLSSAARLTLWGAIAALLLFPAVAMRFTGEVNWGPEDFVAAAILLGGAGLALELAFRFITTPLRRIVAAGGILAVLVLVWVELAVGIFD